MKRLHVILAVLVAVLVVVAFNLLLFQPAREEARELEEQIALEQQQQANLMQEITRLRTVRDTAPEVEAELAAARVIVPEEAALPAALRQLQLAADGSRLVLNSISTSRPVAVADAPSGLSSIEVSVQLSGGYFQLVDFLRRVEDPSITPRGMQWRSARVSISDYPSLNVTLGGRMYAVISTPAPPEEPPADDAPADADAEGEAEDPGLEGDT